MSKRETVQPASLGQLKELMSAIIQAVPTNLSSATAQDWIGAKSDLHEYLNYLLSTPLDRLAIEMQPKSRMRKLRLIERFSLPGVSNFLASQCFKFPDHGNYIHPMQDGIRLAYLHSLDNRNGRVWLSDVTDPYPHTAVETEFNIYELKSREVGARLLPEIGGIDLVAVNPAHIWWLLSQQPNGGKGYLLTNGDRNLFFVTTLDSCRLPMEFTWWWRSDIGGWEASLYRSTFTNTFQNAGTRVFSR